MTVLAMMSGHCNFPANEMVVAGKIVPAPTSHSHETCAAHGAGAISPSAGFMPCPCVCHLDADEYECGECGKVLRVAPHWPNDFAQGDDEADPDEVVYVHVDKTAGRATGEWC